MKMDKWVVEMDFEALSPSNSCSVLISHHFEINASVEISTKCHSAGINSTTILCHILAIQCISRGKQFVTKLLSLSQEKLLLPLFTIYSQIREINNHFVLLCDHLLSRIPANINAMHRSTHFFK